MVKKVVTVECSSRELIGPDKRISFLVLKIVSVATLILLLSFGGVFKPVFFAMTGVVFLLVAFILLRDSAAIRHGISSPLIKQVLTMLVLLFIYCGVTPFINPNFADLGGGGVKAFTENELFRIHFFTLAGVVGFSFLCSYLIPIYSRKIISLLILSGTVAALISLAHWFQDDGKLFWFFSPEYAVPSNRARWPFVNPNHSGHFLIICFFPCLGRFFNHLLKLQSRILDRAKGLRELAFQLSLNRNQKQFLRVIKYGFCLLVMLIAMVATLSRSTWSATALGLSVFSVLIMLNFRRGLYFEPEPGKSRKSSRRRTGKRRSEVKVRKKLLWLVPLAFAGVMLFLLQGKGGELIEGRLEFGLKHSLDDIRWSLYGSSFELLGDNLITGVGPGQWRIPFQKVVTSDLAGLKPAYLHSDPYQFLIEYGLFGFLIVIASSLLILRKGLIWWRAGRGSPVTISCLSGLVAFCFASCFDFPLRIPVIFWCFLILLYMTLFYLDNQDS